MAQDIVAARIRRRLAEMDQDQRWLARMLGKDPSAVSRWLDGSRRLTVDDLERIALVLHRPTAWLLAEDEAVVAS